MLIVLAYSKTEFNPDLNYRSGTGASRLAEACYKALMETFPNSEIVYVDTNEHEEISSVDNCDLLVGIENRFLDIVKRLKPKHLAFISVNTPSWHRFDWILRAIHENPLDAFRLDFSDNSFQTPQPTIQVDLLLQLGSRLNSIDLGELATSVSELNLDAAELRPFENEVRLGSKILYFPGSINVRKGATKVYRLAKRINRAGVGQFVIQGRAHSPQMKRLLKKFMTLGCNVNSDYIDLSSSEWSERVKDVRLAILPSYEEGQADTILQLVGQGIPVLISRNCGFTKMPELLVVERNRTFDWSDRIEELMSLEPKTLYLLAKEQLGEIQKISPLKDQFSSAFQSLKIGLDESANSYGRKKIRAKPIQRVAQFIAFFNRCLRYLGF